MSYHREQKLKKRYGMTQAEFDKRLQQQGGGCKTCGRVSEKFVVDHCHESGKVRGILCGACNLALGMVRDDPNTLRRMIGYLNEG